MKRIISLLLSLYYIPALALQFCGRVYLSSPVALQDWKGMASLIVDSFDKKYDDNSIAWKYWERPRREQHEYSHYTRTARKMKGKKYAIILAKDSLSDNVIGMCELGVSQIDGEGPGTTVGVLAVHPVAQNNGIAQQLLSRCEELAASEAWGYDELYGQILPDNTASIRAFEKAGFQRKSDDLVSVSIRRGFENVEALHYIYAKQLRKRILEDGQESILSNTQLKDESDISK